MNAILNKVIAKRKFMIKKCKEIDIECIGENGFNSINDVNKFWKNKSYAFITKVYNEYYVD